MATFDEIYANAHADYRCITADGKRAVVVLDPETGATVLRTETDAEQVAAALKTDADSASLEELEAASDILDCTTCEHKPYCLSGGLPTEDCKTEPEAFIAAFGPIHLHSEG